MIVAHQFFNFLFILIIFRLRKVIGDSCKTPENKIGTCIKFSECEVLKNLIPLARQHVYYRTYLKQSQCRIENIPWVCCPLNENLNITNRLAASQRVELPKSADNVCGRIFAPNGNFPNRIFGGQETRIGEFPWYALLVYNKPFNMIGYNCGGSLITSTHVFTAAHCASKSVIPSTWDLAKVRLGEKDLSMNADCNQIGNTYYCAPEVIDIDIDKIIVHDLYASQSGSPYDIAILKLAQSVEFNDFIKPVCLPIDKVINTDYGSGFIAGFGKTETRESSDEMLKAEINIINHQECVWKYATQGRAIYSGQICASGHDADSCRGDSGSGFIIQDESQAVWYLIGVTSFGPRKCNTEYPGIYVKVKDHIDWIKNKINE